MAMPWILVTLIVLGVVMLVAWFNSRKTGIVLFVIFLILFLWVFNHHMTDQLPISL
jgi:hypothetical protein|tara:strand:- start:1739 stop:1906 length:168 start_codon:yes stop_codon:yes gene_type:complete